MTVPDIVNDIVLACRALTVRGCDTGIGGHVSVRADGEDAFWINAFDRTLGEITVDDVMKLDYEGNLLEGDREVSLGFEFHAGVYQNRTDVNAIVHSHGRWITALASLARPLKMRHNLCCIFHDDQGAQPRRPVRVHRAGHRDQPHRDHPLARGHLRGAHPGPGRGPSMPPWKTRLSST